MSLDLISILSLIAAFLVGLSKGGLPIVAMLAVPLLATQMSPIKAAAMLLPIYIFSDMVSVWFYRKDFSLENLKILIPAGVFGVFVGWSTASFLSDRAVALFIGILGICFCLNTWFGRKQEGSASPSLRKGLFWGTLSGFTSFLTHAGGPPYQIYILPQKLPKMVFAGTTTILFACINIAKIFPYQQLRPYSFAEIQATFWLMPIALVGTFLGAYFTKRIDDRWFFTLVQMALFLVCCKLVFDAVMK